MSFVIIQFFVSSQQFGILSCKFDRGQYREVQKVCDSYVACVPVWCLWVSSLECGMHFFPQKTMVSMVISFPGQPIKAYVMRNLKDHALLIIPYMLMTMQSYASVGKSIPCFSHGSQKHSFSHRSFNSVWRNPCFAIPVDGKPEGSSIFSAPGYFECYMEVGRGYTRKRDGSKQFHRNWKERQGSDQLF